MSIRRDITRCGMVLLILLATTASMAGPTVAHGDGESGVEGDTVDSEREAVAYVRNVEEVKGHLESSVTLLETGDRESASFHAGHAENEGYVHSIVPAVRAENATLATELRAELASVDAKAANMSAAEYDRYVHEEVFPLLNRSVEVAVDRQYRNDTDFDAHVTEALLGRISGEYDAAVTENGTVELSGEYWDARGFLVRIEDRYRSELRPTLNDSQHERVNATLARLRTEMENVSTPSSVTRTTLDARVAVAAAVGTESATVEGAGDSVTFVRNVEEMRGHLLSSANLSEAGDTEAAALHAGHVGSAQYVTTVLPAVQRANATLAAETHDALAAAPERARNNDTATYRAYIQDEVFPLLNASVEAVVAEKYRSNTTFDRQVTLALADRLNDEYTAAVSEEGVVELRGEYWDARGFLVRMEHRYATMESDLDSETSETVGAELDTLREELEHAETPSDVAGSVEALKSELGGDASGDAAASTTTEAAGTQQATATTTAETTGGSGPGFGIAAAIGALVALAGGALARR